VEADAKIKNPLGFKSGEIKWRRPSQNETFRGPFFAFLNGMEIRKRSFRTVFILIVTLLTGVSHFWSCIALAGPSSSLEDLLISKGHQKQDFSIQSGGAVELEPGMYIEGSRYHGGSQPDYYIDLNTPNVKWILDQAKTIGQSEKDPWQKIKHIDALLNSRLGDKDPKNVSYLQYINDKSQNDQSITLEEYLSRNFAVCREHAILAHFALKAAGFSPQHVYVTQTLGSVLEDHAFNLVKIKGRTYIVDTYEKYLHGSELSEARQGITTTKFARLEKINSYPRYYFPRKRLCSKIFQTGSGL